jgi:hypothetical protein
MSKQLAVLPPPGAEAGTGSGAGMNAISNG